MSRGTPVDPLPHLAAVARALAAHGQPAPAFAALDRALAAALGHKLFTILRWHPDRAESERLYTSQPAAYPVGGRKPLNATAWSRQVLDERRPYIGRTADDIRAHFFDHALIASLGCDSILNIPVVWNDRVLGTLNLLHEAHWYDDADVPLASTFAALAAAAMR
ncbi:MAG TPA: GAF domain-containing protein [Methylomirabilota bacterium]|jgi:GAF domain-containing protein|nr:GAF domain-containing protein [Methylomirabilota bacterium]